MHLKRFMDNLLPKGSAMIFGVLASTVLAAAVPLPWGGDVAFDHTVSVKKGKARIQATAKNLTAKRIHYVEFCVTLPGDEVCTFKLWSNSLEPSAEVRWALDGRTKAASGEAAQVTISRAFDNPPNLAIFPQKCEEVWPILIQTLLDKGFDPDASDRAAGFMKFKYRNGDVSQYRSNPNAQAMLASYTTAPGGLFGPTPKWFRFAGLTAVVGPSGGGCRVDLRAEMQAWLQQGLVTTEGWHVFPSNYRLEMDTLKAVETQLPKTSGPQ